MITEVDLLTEIIFHSTHFLVFSLKTLILCFQIGYSLQGQGSSFTVEYFRRKKFSFLVFVTDWIKQPDFILDFKNAMTSNHQDILQCVYNKFGDLGFMDAYKLESLIKQNPGKYSRSDFMLVCPSGTKVEYTGPQSFLSCNFGRIPTKALVTMIILCICYVVLSWFIIQDTMEISSM